MFRWTLAMNFLRSCGILKAFSYNGSKIDNNIFKAFLTSISKPSAFTLKQIFPFAVSLARTDYISVRMGVKDFILNSVLSFPFWGHMMGLLICLLGVPGLQGLLKVLGHNSEVNNTLLSWDLL